MFFELSLEEEIHKVEINFPYGFLQIAAYCELTLVRPGEGLVLKWQTLFNPSVKVHFGKSPGPFHADK